MAAPNSLSKLTRVTVGQNLLEILTADRINAIQDNILGLYRGENLQSGTHIRLKTSPAGVVISADRGGGSSQANITSLDPWEITTIPPAVEGGASHPVVNPESSVWKKINESVTVVDLDIDVSKAKEGDLIYLEYDFSAATLTLKVERWDGYPDPFKIEGAGTVQDPYVARKYYKQLHRCIDINETDVQGGVPLNDKVQALQDCTSHLSLEDFCHNGLSVFILRESSRSPHN